MRIIQLIKITLKKLNFWHKNQKKMKQVKWNLNFQTNL